MNIYFSGIGGVGIGPLAEIAADAGYQVQGSDLSEGLLTRELAARGIPIATTQDGTFLETSHEARPLDWFVHTAALPADHPELVRARELGIRTAKRDELLAHIIQEKGLQLLAVAGTHGKTTTTGMAVWTFQQLGIPVSYSVGSTLSFGPSGKFDPESTYFIYECDEFDRNFLHFTPHLSLVTSVDYDHPDTYPTKEAYFEAFAEFGRQSDALISWASFGERLFGAHPDAWLLQDALPLALPGLHNRQNGTLVLKALEKLQVGASLEVATEALNRFPGTDRRFERLGAHLYSDYGHHPVEIAATLQLAREVAPDITLVYQPHQNIRQHEIIDQYRDQFEAASTVYWLPTYLSREDPELAILQPEELTAHLTNLSSVHIADLNDELWQAIQAARASGSLVLGMGAGSIDGWLRARLAADATI